MTGAATLIGAFGMSGTALTGLAAVPLTYYLAEGATGAFFDTDLADRQPERSTDAGRRVTYFAEDGQASRRASRWRRSRARPCSVDPTRRLELDGVLDEGHVDHRPAARRRAHDALGRDRLRRAYREGEAELSRTWYFAEGSQGFFQTFLLLTNPVVRGQPRRRAVPARVGAPVQRELSTAPQSRRTIFAGDIPELVNQSFGTMVTFRAPVRPSARCISGRRPSTAATSRRASRARRPTGSWRRARPATFFDLRAAANPGGRARERDADLPPARAAGRSRARGR